ncbi:MAG: hypothetical protein INR65_08145 [Gluconacetobacter diazotrophicus]|nr:hypothetical protein [Gluconacetobacter diazotrophicus]
MIADPDLHARGNPTPPVFARGLLRSISAEIADLDDGAGALLVGDDPESGILEADAETVEKIMEINGFGD